MWQLVKADVGWGREVILEVIHPLHVVYIIHVLYIIHYTSLKGIINSQRVLQTLAKDRQGGCWLGPGALPCGVLYKNRGTSLMRNRAPQGTYSSAMSRALRCPVRGLLFLMSEIPLVHYCATIACLQFIEE